MEFLFSTDDPYLRLRQRRYTNYMLSVIVRHDAARVKCSRGDQDIFRATLTSIKYLNTRIYYSPCLLMVFVAVTRLSTTVVFYPSNAKMLHSISICTLLGNCYYCVN